MADLVLPFPIVYNSTAARSIKFRNNFTYYDKKYPVYEVGQTYLKKDLKSYKLFSKLTRDFYIHKYEDLLCIKYIIYTVNMSIHYLEPLKLIRRHRHVSKRT